MMDLKEVMKQRNFVVVGNTTDPEKYACKIKNAMLDNGYNVYSVGTELASINDVPADIDVIDLCINDARGLELLKECKKTFKNIVIQPGAEGVDLLSYLMDNDIPYIQGCLLVGLKNYVL